MSTITAVVRPRPVFCVVAEEHRDVARARAVAGGTFTHLGTTVRAGCPPDWLRADLPPDEEWRIDWWKFGYGVDLAHAYATTSDERFRKAWSELVESFVASVPVGTDATEVAARRVQNWIYSWPAFVELAPELERRLFERIENETRYIREQLTAERNHRTLELYGLLLVALAFPSLDTGGGLSSFALEELHRNLLVDFRADGVHREASSHYHLLVLRSLIGARENARRFGASLPPGFDDLLGRACDFALQCHRPDGAIAALSDSDSTSFAGVLGLAGELLDRDDLRWVASAGARGAPPTDRFAEFPCGGYYFQRSGWGDRDVPYGLERFLVFDCGPVGDGGHGHYDLLSVEVAAGGQPLVLDPGRYTYSEEPPNFRRWFKSTAAHSTVSVDGLDQTPYRPGKPKGALAEGRLLWRHTDELIDMLLGQAVSPVYDAVHTRRVVFVAGRYWLIEDRLEAPTPHRYDVRFQLSSAADGHATVEGPAVRAPGVAVVSGGSQRPRLEDGWVAPSYGTRLAAPVVSVSVDDVRDATFVTLIAPVQDDQRTPALSVSRTRAGAVVDVNGAREPGQSDRIRWTPTSVGAELGLTP
jgi:Heparinase II/III-like protein/Heparinase II/III N-terminus